MSEPKHRSGRRFLLEGLEGVVLLLVFLTTWPFARLRLENWGSHPDERRRSWLGDEFVGTDHESYVRAIDVDAPAEGVWAWVVQFGLGRAGFYSYELLERLVGIPVKNVESIVPELQTLTLGEEIRLHPKAPGIPVAAVDPGRHLCFGDRDRQTGLGRSSDPARSWSIYLEPTSTESCRLLLRGCLEPYREPSVSKRLGRALEAPIDFLMEQRMLRSIRRLAEASFRDRGVES